MKKTILTIMVAAMMLVAFTACEQQVPDLNGQVPTNAIITQTGTFVEGQMFDPTQFSVKLTYKNGYTETVSGANIVTLDSEEAYVVPGDTVSVNVTTVGGTSNGQQMIGNAQLNVKKIESVTVVAPKSVNEGDDINSMAVKSLFTVTVNYDGGTIAVKPSEFKIVNLTTTSADNDPENPANDSVTIDVYLASDAKVASSDEFSVVVIDPDAEPTEEPEYVWLDHQVVWGQVEASSSVKYIKRGIFNADNMIDLYKVYVKEGETTTDNGFYLIPLTASDYKDLTIELASTGGYLDANNKNRFADSDSIAVTFSMTYVSDDVYGELKTVEATNGSIDLADLEEVKAADMPAGLTGKVYTLADGSSISTTATAISITDLIDDYPTAVKVESSSTKENPVAEETEHKGLITSDIISVLGTSWASGYTPSKENQDLEDSTYTITFDPEKASVPETAAAESVNQMTVKYTVEMTTQYEKSTVFTGSFSEYVKAN